MNDNYFRLSTNAEKPSRARFAAETFTKEIVGDFLEVAYNTEVANLFDLNMRDYIGTISDCNDVAIQVYTEIKVLESNGFIDASSISKLNDIDQENFIEVLEELLDSNNIKVSKIKLRTVLQRAASERCSFSPLPIVSSLVTNCEDLNLKELTKFKPTKTLAVAIAKDAVNSSSNKNKITAVTSLVDNFASKRIKKEFEGFKLSRRASKVQGTNASLKSALLHIIESIEKNEDLSESFVELEDFLFSVDKLNDNSLKASSSF